MDQTHNPMDLQRRGRGPARSVCLLLALAMAGCATTPLDSASDYPSTFLKLASPTGACPAIGGPIANRGLRHNPDSGLDEPAIMTRDVLGLPERFADSDLPSLHFVQSTSPGLFGPTQAHVQQLVAGSGMAWQMRADISICASGVYHYNQNSTGGFTPAGMDFWSEPILFQTAVDGSLVVRHAHQSAGIVLVVPYKLRTSTSYYRFPVQPGEVRAPK